MRLQVVSATIEKFFNTSQNRDYCLLFTYISIPIDI